MSVHKVVEQVPPLFVRRNGDWAQEGGNNALIVLGTDRAAAGPASVDDGLGTVEAPGGGKGTGTAHITVGRKQVDPDFGTDDAFLYLSQKTNADQNLGADGIETATQAQPAAVLKSTDIRIVFGGPDGAGNLKIYFDDTNKDKYVFIDGTKARVQFKEGIDVTLDAHSVTAEVGENSVIIKDDGTVTVTADTATVNARTKAEVKVGNSDIVADASKVDVKATAVNITAATTITGPTVINGTLVAGGTLVGAIAVGGGGSPPAAGTGLKINSSGDISGAGKIAGDSVTAKTVTASVDVQAGLLKTSLVTHKHTDSKGGPTTPPLP